MDAGASQPGTWSKVAIGVAIALFVAAVAVRGWAPARPIAPEDVVEDGPRLEEPMQFLGAGASLRVAELDAWVAAERRGRFKAQRELVFHLEGCPPLLEWIASIDGQRLERLMGELRGGTREEALASLTLLYQLARATEWKPAIVTTTPSAPAERLGALFQDWLRAWGERGAGDPVLSEAAVATTLVYARIMHVAENAPVLGTLGAPRERARGFLADALQSDANRRSKLGELVQGRHATAWARFTSGDDPLAAFASDAATLFPDLKGNCTR